MFYFGFLGNGSGASFIPGTVPKVISSTIGGDGSTIMVRFDRPMNLTTDAHLALSAIKNGGAPIVPDHIIAEPQSPRTIGLVYAPDTFVSTDTIVWSYNDQHPTAKIKGAEVGGIEIDNQTYLVSNSISHLIHFKTPPKKVMDYWELTDISDAPKMDGILHSANHVACTPTKYVDLPIIHTLGNDNININDFAYIITGDEVATISTATPTGFKLDVTAAGTNTNRPYMRSPNSTKSGVGNSFKCSFDIISTGDVSLVVKVGGVSSTIKQYTTGHYELYLTGSTVDSNVVDMIFDGTKVFTAEVSNFSVKELTIPANSYVTRYDVATKQFIQVANEHDVDATTVNEITSPEPFATTSFLATATTTSGVTTVVRKEEWSGALSECNNLKINSRYIYSLNILNSDGTHIGYKTDKASGAHVNLVQDKFDTLGKQSVEFIATANVAYVGVYSNEGVNEVTITYTPEYVKEILPVSTTYKMTTAFSQYFTHSKALTQADLDALNTNPNLIADIWLNGVSLPSGFKKSDMVDYFGANEGKLDKLYNEKDGSVATIQAYTDAVRDTYKNVLFGVQNFFLEQDASGRTTASYNTNMLIGGTDNRYIDIEGGIQLVEKPCVVEMYGHKAGSMKEVECNSPKVLSSIIGHDGHGIVVTFDRPIAATIDAANAINVVVDGAQPKHPFRVLIDKNNPKIVGLEFSFSEFDPGEVVTWSYDNTHATGKITSAGIEIGTNSNNVVNHSNTAIVNPEGAQVTHTGQTVNVFLSDVAYGEFTTSAWVVDSQRALHTVTSISSGAGIISLAITPRIEQADTNIRVTHVKQAVNNVNSFSDLPAVNAAIDELFIRVPNDVSMSGSEVNSYTKLNDFGFDLAVTTAGTIGDKPLLNCDTVSKTPAWYAFEFDATLTSGDTIIAKVYDGSTHVVNHVVHDGINIMAGEATSTSNMLGLYFDGTKEFDCRIEHCTLFKFSDATPPSGEKMVMTVGENAAINIRGYSISLRLGDLNPLFIEDFLVHDLFVRDDGTKKFIQLSLDRPIPEIDYIEIKYKGQKVNLYVNSVISNTLFYAVGQNVNDMYDLIYALPIPSDVNITVRIVRK